MPESVNIERTSGGNVTEALPHERRIKRESKAMAIVQAYRPPAPPVPEFVPYIPPRPDATFTYYGRPREARITGSIVYFMYSGGRIKIGVSNGLRDRHGNLKKAGAFPPTILLVIDGTEKDERLLHRRFADDRLHGEWFSLSTKLRSYLVYRLCDVGRASLDAAEREFREICAAYLARYRDPPKRSPHPLCPHDVPMNHRCPNCERDRDLMVLEALKVQP